MLKNPVVSLTPYQSSNFPGGQRGNPICLISHLRKVRQKKLRIEGYSEGQKKWVSSHRREGLERKQCRLLGGGCKGKKQVPADHSIVLLPACP